MLDRNVVNWKGLDGIGRDGTGLRAQTPLNGMNRIKPDWSTRQRSRQDWTAPDSTTLHWIGLKIIMQNSQFTAPR